MAFTATWERISDPDDPRRCQGITGGKAQCINKACDGSSFCPAHGGNNGAQNKERKELRNYRLSKFHQRVAELGNSDEIISLRDEVGLLRLLIEEKVNQCNDNTDLLLISGPLSDLIMKSEKLVTSCNRLENRLGNLLDKTKIINFAQYVVEIISRYIIDNDTLEQIASEILKGVSSQVPKQDNRGTTNNVQTT